MKTLKLKTFIRVHCWLLGLLLVGAAASLTAQTSPWGAAFRQRVAAMFLQAQTAATPQMAAVVAPANNTFYVRSYCGKCLAYGAPPPKREPVSPIVSTGAPAQANSSPVFIYDCNRHRTVASDILVDAIPQQVRVEEINDRHEVILHAGSKVIGVTANFLIEQAPLELQDENRSAGQVFAFDGDSIILAADRNLVVKVQGKRGKNRTPLALGRRDLDDAEFWTFTATDGSTRRPTSGFVRVPQAQEPQAQAWELWSAIHQAQPGTVIEVEASIDLTHLHNLKIPAGVTIRGDRRGANPGPELRTQYDRDETMLEIAGDDVRITGLRLRGPSRSLDQHQPNITGIRAPDEYLRSIIDHNDLSDWPGAGVGVDGDRLPGGGHDFVCRSSDNYRPHNVRVARNFIHHNQREGLGYGVVAGDGGSPSIEGNTFYLNRHAIAADGTALSGYSAFFNLVLSDAPCYGFLCHDHEQDFDMHGSDPSSHHTGGYGGGAVEIARNTFLGVNRRNFDLRGQACALDEFHNNISRQSAGDAIRWFVPSHPFSLSGDQVSPPNSPPAWLDIRDNRFNSQDPTQHLGVGDFDGDGKDDLFLATGAAWYYAPAGKAEWRFLSAKTEQIGALLFGDFDGDGRTDVFTQYGRDWLISWGGISPWEKINESDARMSDFAIGDFDGDHRADVFYANGHEWYVSYGGVGPFIHIAFAIHRAPDLRFGDFNGDGKTDVFGVVGDYWMVVYGETQYWAPLRPKLTDTVADLIVADFDGDGRADIATSSRQDIFNWGNWVWKVSRGGISDWTTLRTDGLPLASVAAIGRFDESAGADVLLWNSRWLDIVSSGTATPQPYTTQQMR